MCDNVWVKVVEFLIVHKDMCVKKKPHILSFVVCCDKNDLYISDITHLCLKINGNFVYGVSHHRERRIRKIT